MSRETQRTKPAHLPVGFCLFPQNAGHGCGALEGLPLQNRHLHSTTQL